MKLPPVGPLIGLHVPENPNKEIVKSFDPDKLGPKKVHMTWSAPNKLEMGNGNKKISRTFIIIGVFLGLILAVMQEFGLIVLIASMMFVFYAIKKASPEKVTHEISNHGFSYAGELYYWHQLKNFFFDKNNLLVISTYDPLPGRLFVIFDQDDKKKIQDHLEEYIHYLPEVPKTSLDKFYEFVVDKLNL